MLHKLSSSPDTVALASAPARLQQSSVPNQQLLLQLYGHVLQNCVAGEATHKAAAAGQHHPAVLGAAAGSAPVECGSRGAHRPRASSAHGDSHEGKPTAIACTAK